MDHPTHQIKAVVFDLDDTLYPEKAYIQSGFRAVSRQIAQLEAHLEGQVVYELLCKEFEQGQRQQVFDKVLEHLGLIADDQMIAELVSLYRCHRPALELDDSVRKVLDQLTTRYKLGLLTDGYLPAQKLKVESLALETTFDHIIYTEELGRQYWKPAPRPYELITDELGVSHNQCAYIADNPAKDFIAPNQLGWRTIQLHRPEAVHTHAETPPNGKPQFTVDNITQIPSKLL